MNCIMCGQILSGSISCYESAPHSDMTSDCYMDYKYFGKA